jgi:lipopolysaccharide/colanic/teichoic acid biosynthesis glycosyltransferase
VPRNKAGLSASLRTLYNGFQWKTFMHRALDVIIACILIVLVLPLMAVVALAIKLDSPGPVLCRTGRGELDERYQSILLRFRTAPCRVGRIGHNAPRTRLGQFLHITGIEELPLLFNILRGDLRTH